MRIIAGEHRGRQLKSPPDQRTRPMLDRVREALFSSLGERVDGARVLDLFAGTGSLALEALSRGASMARLVERDPKVVKLLRENVAALALEERAEIAPADALQPSSWTARDGGGVYDLVFVDSPYPLLTSAATRRMLLRSLDELVGEHLAPDGVLVFHAPHAGVAEHDFGERVSASLRAYGTNDLWRLEKREQP